MLDYDQLRKTNVVAIQPEQNTIFSKIDFADIVPSTNPAETVILNLNQAQMIDHTFPKIDRCCKLNHGKVKHDGIDNRAQIDVVGSTSQGFFELAAKHMPVMLNIRDIHLICPTRSW